MSSFLLSPKQVAFRNAALVRNLRQEYPQIANHSDEAIILAYVDWFFGDDTSNEEEDFIALIEEPSE